MFADPVQQPTDAARNRRLVRVNAMSNAVPISEAQRRLLQRYLSAKAPQRARIGLSRRQIEEPACLSIGQEAMWRHMRSDPELTCYNEPITVHRRGALDVSLLERSLTEVVRRQEAWRTTFAMIGDCPVQIVHDAPDSVTLPVSDVCHLPEADREAEALRLASLDACLPFDLERGPLFRPRLVRLESEYHKLFVTAHHLILDGVTVFDIFFSELVTCYNALQAGKMPSLPDAPVHFSDFAYWQRELMQDFNVVSQLSYWRKQLAGQRPTQFPTKFPRPPIKTYRGHIRSFTLSKVLTDELRIFSQQQGAGMFVILVAAFVALLYRYTSQQDITVGTVVPGGRKELQSRRTMGLMQTRVPLRVDLTGNPTARELLVRVRTVVTEALCHDDVPLEVVVRELQPHYEPSSSPFFDTMISLEPRVPNVGPGWDFTTMDAQPAGARLDLYIELDDRPSGMLGRAQYNTDLFTDKTIGRIIDDFQATLKALCKQPESPISEITALTLVDNSRTEVTNRMHV